MAARGFAKERPAVVPLLEATPKPGANKVDFEKLAERIVLREYGPPWVVANESFEIIHTRGDTGPFLQLPAGAPSFDLLKMTRDSLRGELRKLLTKAKEENVATQSSTYSRNGWGEIRRVGLEVRRFRPRLLKDRFFS